MGEWVKYDLSQHKLPNMEGIIKVISFKNGGEGGSRRYNNIKLNIDPLK